MEVEDKLIYTRDTTEADRMVMDYLIHQATLNKN